MEMFVESRFGPGSDIGRLFGALDRALIATAQESASAAAAGGGGGGGQETQTVDECLLAWLDRLRKPQQGHPHLLPGSAAVR
jgi:hypothetical protein